MKKLLLWFKSLLAPAADDPVYHCKVYRDKLNGGCVHVDGLLCDFATCSMRLARERNQQPPWGGEWLLQEQANGLILLQNQPRLAVDLTGGDKNGWLFECGDDGKWVAKRPLQPWEVMQAEDQQFYGMIQPGCSGSPS